MRSRLAPTNVGTLCAFLTGREKCGLVFQKDFPSGNRRLDAPENGAKHSYIVPDTGFRLPRMPDRLNEMIENGHPPISDRFLKRDFLCGAVGTPNRNNGMIPVL